MTEGLSDCVGKIVDGLDFNRTLASLRFEDGATFEVTSGSSEVSWLNVTYPYEVDELLGQAVAGVAADRRAVRITLVDGSHLAFELAGSEDKSLDAYLYA